MDNEEHTLWNNNILVLLNKIGRKTMGYRWMHDQASQYNQKIHKNYKIVELVLAAMLDLLTGGELCGFIFNNGLNLNKSLIIGIACTQFILLLISHIISGISTVSEFEKNISQHDYASTKFGELNLSIQQKLALDIHVRGDDKEFLNHIIKSFSDLLVIAPKIDQWIQDEYIEKSADNDVFAPISTDTNSVSSDEVQIPLEEVSNYQIERWLKNF